MLITVCARNSAILSNLRAISHQPTRGKCRKPIPEVGKTTYVYRNVPEHPHPTEEFEKDEFLPRRLSYWPPDVKQLRLKSKIKPWRKIREHITVYPPEDEELPEYYDEPQYPPITDFRVYTPRLEEKANRRIWYDQLKALPTFDQKMFAITDIKRHPTVTLKAWSHVYNNLPMYQRVTHTRLVTNALPDSYDQLTVNQHVRDTIRNSVLDAIRLHFNDAKEKKFGTENVKRRPIGNFGSKSVSRTLNVENLIDDVSNICVKQLSAESHHLLEAQYDYLPDILSFWFAGDLPVPSSHVRYSYRQMKTVDQAMQYQDTPVLNIRHAHPLTAAAPFDSHDVGAREDYNHHPRQCGYKLKWCSLASVPGFWPEHQEQGFPFLSFYSRDVLKQRHSVNEMFADEDEAIDGIGMMSSFAWLNAIAANHGFTPFQELTYPFTTQTIVTDGRTWSFFVYQLNRHSFHSDFGTPSCDNICWSSGPIQLYESYENGSFSGVNDEAIDMLVKFFVRKPTHDPELVLRPYIGVDEREQKEIDDTRIYLKRRFAQGLRFEESQWLKNARVPAYEHIFMRPTSAPSTIHWRKMFRYPNKLRTNRNQFTV